MGEKGNVGMDGNVDVVVDGTRFVRVAKASAFGTSRERWVRGATGEEVCVIERVEVNILKDRFCYRGRDGKDCRKSGFISPFREVNVFDGDGWIGGGDMRGKLVTKVSG